MNVPEKSNRKLNICRKKLKWIVYGIFAPELVVFTAWRQWTSARRLTHTVNKCFKEQASPPLHPTPNSNTRQGVDANWTMAHSFFAQMGGFAFDTASHGAEYIPSSPRLYLTANGVAALAHLGRLPRISRSYISDKSKADDVTKALATVQASWLVVQCAGRAAAGLPISLLEYNTLAHALCSLVMYCLWWSKPLNIADPMILKGEWVAEVGAAMWMLSRVSTFAAGEDVKPPEIVQFVRYERARGNATNDLVLDMEARGLEEIGSLAGEPSRKGKVDDTPGSGPKATLQTSECMLATTDLEPDRLIEPEAAGFLLHNERSSHLSPSFNITKNRVLLPVGFSLANLSEHFPPNPVGELFFTRAATRKCPTSIPVTPATLKRWQLATACYDAHPSVWTQHKTTLSEFRVRDDSAWTVSKFPANQCRTNYVDVKIPNWPGNDLVGGAGTVASHVVFSAACTLVYATIHALAWRGYFPTENERTMWVVSAVGIGGSGLVWLALYFFWAWVEVTVVDRKGLVGRCLDCGFLALRTVFAPLSTCVACGVVAFYVFARFFLVFEAFFSLRALPLEMYQAPQWTQYLNHL